MVNKVFDTLVKKLIKSKEKLISLETIWASLKRMDPENFSIKKLYKIVYYLKIRGYLENLKKNVFIVKDPDHIITKDEIIDHYYREIVKKHCNEFLKGNWYIGWFKALELNMSSFDVPDELLIVNQYKQANEVIMFDKQVLFKTYGKNKEQDKLFNFFYKMTKRIVIGKQNFSIAGLELAILESLYNPSMISQGYINELVKKTLRKYAKSLDTSIWEQILRKSKHNTSINRLYNLCKTIDPTLSEKIKAIIKRYGYFI